MQQNPHLLAIAYINDHELARGDGEEDKEKHQQRYEGILQLLKKKKLALLRGNIFSLTQ